MRLALTSEIADLLRRAKAVDTIAAGKAASAMLTAFAAETDLPVRTMLGVGPRNAAIETSLPGGAVWCDAGHPLPDAGSLEGARRALDLHGRLYDVSQVRRQVPRGRDRADRQDHACECNGAIDRQHIRISNSGHPVHQ